MHLLDQNYMLAAAALAQARVAALDSSISSWGEALRHRLGNGGNNCGDGGILYSHSATFLRLTYGLSLPIAPPIEFSGTVNVNTTPTRPVYVDADRPARNSFSASCFTNNYDSNSGQASCTIFTIPARRQVVVESVSCTAEVAAGQGPAQADLIIPNIPYGSGPGSGVIAYQFPLAMTKQTLNTGTGADIWAITNQFRAYGRAPSDGSVDIGVFFRASLPNLNPPQGMNCTIAGYVVP